MVTVIIEGLEFYAHHGVSQEEQAIGHRYRVDAELDLDAGACSSDDIAETVNYGEVCATIEEIAHLWKMRTLERLADVICDKLLAKFSLVQEIRLSIYKELPPAPYIVRRAGARISKRRTREK